MPQPSIKEMNLRTESKRILTLCSPILLAQILQVAVITTDTIMAGRYSAADLSGVAIGGSIWFPTFLFLFGLLSALTPTVAHLHGEENYKDIAPTAYQAIWLAIVLCPLTLALGLLLPMLLELFQADASIRPITTNYLQALVTGLLPLLLYNVLRFYCDGLSLTKPALVASFIGLLINIPLNYVLIYGKFGFPELGGEGCGWASAASFLFMFIYMLFVVASKKSFKKCYLYSKVYLPEKDKLVKLLKLGLPIAGANFVEASMFGIVALFLASLGTVTMAAHQIALNVAALVFMIPLSLSMALTIRVGYLVGAKEVRHAKLSAYFGLMLAVCYAFISASALFLFREPIVLLYNTDAEVVALASTLLIYAAVFQLGDALQVTAAGILRGYKDTKVPMLIMLCVFWCFALPLGYTLSFTDLISEPRYAEGFWTALVVGLLLVGLALIIRLKGIANKYLKQVDTVSTFSQETAA